MGLNILWVKLATHRKAEPLTAASLSKLDNMVNKKSISSIKYAEFSKKKVEAPLFSQP